MALTFTLEAFLYVDDPPTTQEWVNLTSDVVISDGVRWTRGIPGRGPLDRVASTGSLTFTLRSNPVGTYNPNSLTGWGLNTAVRVTLADGTNTEYRFRGFVQSLTPGAGSNRAGKRVRVLVYDHFAAFAEIPVERSSKASYVNKRADELLALILPNTGFVDSDLDTGDNTFPYALDDVQDGVTPTLQAMARLVLSEPGYLYGLGDGTIRFEKRTARAALGTAAATIAGAFTDLDFTYTRNIALDKATVTAHPRRIGTVNTTILFSRHTIASGDPALPIAAGASVTVFGPYGDPDNANARCGGTDMQTVTATTDYTANAQADGLGTDKTSSLAVAASLTNAGASLVLTNSDTATIYVTKLQCRGRGIYDRQPVSVTETITAPLGGTTGGGQARLDMPYQSDANVVDGVAAQLLDTWRYAKPCAVTFNALTAARLAAAIVVEIGDLVTVSETSSGLSINARVQSIQQSLTSSYDVLTTWGLVPDASGYYWVLGQTGASELDSTTRLFY